VLRGKYDLEKTTFLFHGQRQELILGFRNMGMIGKETIDAIKIGLYLQSMKIHLYLEQWLSLGTQKLSRALTYILSHHNSRPVFRVTIFVMATENGSGTADSEIGKQ
jgi:hypothetical protein